MGHGRKKVVHAPKKVVHGSKKVGNARKKVVHGPCTLGSDKKKVVHAPKKVVHEMKKVVHEACTRSLRGEWARKKGRGRSHAPNSDRSLNAYC